MAWVGCGVAGASATELPTAEPDDRSLGCSEQGRGYIRIPGTNVCLRMRGEVYSQYSVGRGEETSLTTGYDEERPTAKYETVEIRDGFNGAYADGEVSLQAVADTENGPLFASIGLEASRGSIDLNEAYIAWAGLTAGFRYSTFDFSVGYSESPGLSSDRTTNLFAYAFEPTPQLTVTASVEDGALRRFEDGRWTQYAGQSIPDLVASIDYTPEKGSFHAAVAIHHVEDLRDSQSELGWAAILGVEREFRYGDKQSGRLLLTGAVVRGALDYLGIPANASDYIRDEAGDLRLSSGLSGLASYQHYWSSKVRSAVTASAYRTETDADSLVWKSHGFWLTAGSEYLLVPGLILGLDVTYYRDVIRADGPSEPASADARSVVGYAYVKRNF